MRRVTCWNDLAPFGIVPLTGKACGLNYRILFDVTEQGRHILGKCFGIPCLHLAEAWNRGDSINPHVGSIMLSREMFVPVGIFALLETGCAEVWQDADGSLLGIDQGDALEHVAAAKRLAHASLVRTYRYGGTAGDRNLHMMSGRTN